jgi:hypothetical protein
MVRYNADLTEAEMYNGLGAGLGWEVIRTVRPAPITVQTLGPGNYATFDYFGINNCDAKWLAELTVVNPQRKVVLGCDTQS